MVYRYLLMLLLGAAAVSAAGAATRPQAASIAPGAVWRDTQGHEIEAHGGGVLQLGRVFYWFGEDRGLGPGGSPLDPSKRYVSCYTSADLVHWTHHPDALVLADPEHLGPRWVLERPKVYPARHGHPFVMYFHLDDSHYRFARVAIAVSASPCGPYRYVRSFRPLGQESRDIGQFIDEDGTGYLLFESRPTGGFYIARLTPDNMAVAGQASFVHAPLEADTLAHVGDMYYVLGSHMTGWRPNPDVYAVAKSVAGPWSGFRDIAAPAANTYDSQPTMLFALRGSRTTTLIYMGDIWKAAALWDSRYLWMPLEVNGETLHLPPPAPWSINVRTGKVTQP